LNWQNERLLLNGHTWRKGERQFSDVGCRLVQKQSNATAMVAGKPTSGIPANLAQLASTKIEADKLKKNTEEEVL